MDKIPGDDILQMSINTYKMFGEYMGIGIKKLILYRLFNIATFTLNIVFSVISLSHIGSDMYMRTIEGGTTALHVLLKYLSFLYYKKDIEILFQHHGNFWNHDKFSKKLLGDISRIHQYGKNVQKIILIATTCIMTIYSLRPALSSTTRYIFHWWIPYDSIPLEAVALFSQYYFIILCVPVIFAYDSVYLSYSVHVISQLKLLSYRLEYAAVSDGEINECIRYHQLLLNLFDRMKSIFFWMLLFHYMVTFISGCCQLYTIMTGNMKPIDLLSAVTYIVALLFQFAYYTIPAEQIVQELHYVSTAIYGSDWLERTLKQKKLLLFTMMRAQNQKYLSIGGFMDMNVDAFGSVLRKIFSFCTVIRNVLNK